MDGTRGIYTLAHVSGGRALLYAGKRTFCSVGVKHNKNAKWNAILHITMHYYTKTQTRDRVPLPTHSGTMAVIVEMGSEEKEKEKRKGKRRRLTQSQVEMQGLVRAELAGGGVGWGWMKWLDFTHISKRNQRTWS